MLQYCYRLLRSLSFIVPFLLALSVHAAFAAGSGTLKGKVIDRETKDALPGAIVVLRGTNLGASADLNGNFVVYNISPGEYVVAVSYVGYRSDTLRVNITEGQTTQRNVSLLPQVIEGQTVVVTAQAQGQMQAINQQLSSNSIVNVVSEAKIQELPDFNAAEAIGRLPGISTVRSAGEANKISIRGLAPEYNLVSINGVTLGATNNYDKGFDLSLIPSTMLQSIDVHKALTPDMDANAIGGTVNMQLREAQSGFHTNLLWQSGYTNKNKEYGNYKANAAVSDRFLDDALGVYVLGTIESYDRGDDNFGASYTMINSASQSGNEYGDVYVGSMTLTRHFETRKRYGGNLALDYKLPNGSLSLLNMYDRLNAKYHDYNTAYNFIGTHSITYTFSDGNSNTDLGLSILQGKYDFDFCSADFSASNSYTRTKNPDQANFIFTDTGGLSQYVGGPTYGKNTLPEYLYSTAKFDTANAYLDQIGSSFLDYKQLEQAFQLNFKVPVKLETIVDVTGFLKFGGKYNLTHRINDQQDPFAQMRYQGNTIIPKLREEYPDLLYSSTAQRLYASYFTNNDASLISSFLDDRYGTMLWAPNTNRLYAMLNSIEQKYTNDNNWNAGQYHTKRNDYEEYERFYAGYGMAELNVGPDILIVGGARFEQSNVDFRAYYVKQQNTQSMEVAKQLNSTTKNRYVLPNAQIKYNLFEWADVRYAYTQSLSRPKFGEMSPYVNMDQSGQYVNAGNPNLKPAHSYNQDLMFTVHSNELGLFSVGLFYKEIEDFSYYVQYALLDSSFIPGFATSKDYSEAMSGAYLTTIYNNPYKAYVKGIEFDLQTRLWYLPSPFDGLVINLNYAHMKSNTNYPILNANQRYKVGRTWYVKLTDSTRTGRLVYQPDDVLNASLGYDYKDFSARFSFLFQGNMTSGIGVATEQDGTTKDYFRMDAMARQKLPWEGFSVFLEINNINARSDLSTNVAIDGTTSQQYYGLTADLGVRYDF